MGVTASRALGFPIAPLLGDFVQLTLVGFGLELKRDVSQALGPIEMDFRPRRERFVSMKGNERMDVNPFPMLARRHHRRLQLEAALRVRQRGIFPAELRTAEPHDWMGGRTPFGPDHAPAN